jgi:hypothetical protein
MSTPLALRSFRASAICCIISACASGTSLKVKTPQPSLKRRYAPKEMRAQNGSYHVVREILYMNWDRRTYHRHDFLLDLFGERDDFHVHGKVNLYYVSIRVHVNPVQGVPYRGQEHRDADGLLGACHVCGDSMQCFLTRVCGRVSCIDTLRRCRVGVCNARSLN